MHLEINADFAQKLALDTTSMPWIASPQGGVERRMLDRIGGEVARATSLVRYAPKSDFPAHGHEEGEEFLVLSGIFSDEHGDYPPLTYVRNPPGSNHSPRSAGGCEIFVKLRQMRPAETLRKVVPPEKQDWQPMDAEGGMRALLHASPYGDEIVAIERLPSGYRGKSVQLPHGEEILILAGSLVIAGERHEAGMWLRHPAGFVRALEAPEGAEFWVKRGHL